MFAFRPALAHRDGRDLGQGRDKDGVRLVLDRQIRRGGVSESELRTLVIQDLSALLNTVNMESGTDLGDFPLVCESVLNYGIPDLTSRTADDARMAEFDNELKLALERFEPRLLPETLKVKRIGTVEGATLTVRVGITADLMCNPHPVEVQLVADLEVESGDVRITGG